MKITFIAFDPDVKLTGGKGADLPYTLDLKNTDWTYLVNFLKFLYDTPQVKEFTIKKEFE